MNSESIRTAITTNGFPFVGALFAALVLAAMPAAARAQGAAPAAPPPPPPQILAQGPQADSGWLGISMMEIKPDQVKSLKLPADRGVYVSDVSENSPAAKAGLQTGDVITDYDGQRVEGTLQFRRLVLETPPGRTVQISVWRNGRAQTISAEIGSLPPAFGNGPVASGPQNTLRFYRAPNAPPPPNQNFDFGPRAFQGPSPGPNGNFQQRPRADAAPMLGASVQILTGQLGNYFGAPNGEGILITDVRQDSPAEKAGLKAGDVITKVDGTAVRNVGELQRQLRDSRAGDSVTLTVLRKGAESSIQVALGGESRGGAI